MDKMSSTNAPGQFAVQLSPPEAAELLRRLDVAETTVRLMRARLRTAQDDRRDPWGAVADAVRVSRRVP